MASLFTDARRTEMYQFFNVAFNAAPGLVYLSQLRDAVEANLSTKDIVNIFTTKSQFLSVYPSILTNLDFANRLVNNVIKDSASNVAKMEAVNDIVASLNLGLSRGDVIFQVFSNLANITDMGNKYFGVSQQFQKQIVVARYYTEALLGNAEDVLTLQRVIRNVTNNSDVSTDAAIQNLINGGTSGANANLAVVAQAPSVNEGTSTFFSITGADANTDLTFAITGAGIQPADILGGQLAGTVRSDSNGNAVVSLGILADNLTEGTETLTFTVAGRSASTNIVDISRGNNAAPVAPAFTAQAMENGAAITGAVIATDANGDPLTYSLVAAVPGLVLNSNGTYTFNPAGNPIAQALRYSDPAAQIVANYSVSDGQVSTPGTLTISVTPTPLTFSITPNATSAEGSPATFVVTASEDLTSSLSVMFTLNPGNPGGANSGTNQTNTGDFSAGTLQQTVTIPTGSRTATFTVTPAGDAVTELTESYSVTAVVNGTTLTTASGTVTDAAPPQTFTLTASPTLQTVVEGNAGTTPLAYTLTLNQAPTSAVTFTVTSVSGNNGSEGLDYTILARQIVFNVGETTKTNFNLAEIIGDITVEGPEAFVLRISGPNLAQSVDVAVNITDDDGIGRNFNLTLGQDSGPAFVGTASADTYTSGALTQNANDSLDGAGGTDTLNATVALNVPVGFATKDIEILNFTAIATSAVDFTTITGATEANSVGSSAALTVNNIGDAKVALGLQGANNNSITANYTPAAISGPTDTLTVNLRGSSNSQVVVNNGFEAVKVNTTTASTLATLTAPGAATATLSNAARLTVNDGTLNAFRTINIDGAGGAVLGSIAVGNLRTLDASASTGAITQTVDTTTGLVNGTSSKVISLDTAGGSISTGSGNDIIGVSANTFTTSATSINLGAGDDNLRIVDPGFGTFLASGGSGNDVFYAQVDLRAGNVIDGGDGIDTVNFFAGANSTFIARGVERIGFQGTTNTVNLVGADTAAAISDSGTAATTVTGLVNGSSYTSTAVKTGVTSLGFSSGQNATLTANFMAGTSGAVTTTNVKNLTITTGAASTLGGSVTGDAALTSLTINATGTLGMVMPVAIVEAPTENLESLTVTGNAAVTLDEINNNDRLKTVSVSTTAGDVTVGDIQAIENVADVSGAQISVSTTNGAAKLGNVSILGIANTALSSIQSIAVSGTVDSGGSTSIGAIFADSIGTLAVSSTGGSVSLFGATVGANTIANTTDGVITSISANAANGVTVGQIRADSIGSISLASTNASSTSAAVFLGPVLGNAAAVGPIPGALSVGAVTVSSAAGAVTTAPISASSLGNFSVNAKTTATVNNITVLNATGTAQSGSFNVVAGTSATLFDLVLDRSGNVSVRTLGGDLTHGEIEFEDTAARTVAFDAVGNIVSTASKTIENIGGDLTLTAKASGAFSVGGTTVSVGVMTPPPTDLDLIADFSQVGGDVGAMATPVTLRNFGTDDASSVSATGGRASNFITIDARGGTVTYQGQNGVDTLSLMGAYKTSQINTEGGNDVIIGGAGNDVINAGAGADVITGGLGADVITGGADADRYVYAQGDSSSTATDAISGYETMEQIDPVAVVTRADTIAVAAGVAGLAGTGAAATFNAADVTLAQRIIAVQAGIAGGAGHANGESAHWQQGGDTYVFISDGVAGVGANDIIIQLVGIDSTNAAFDVLTIANSNLTLA